MNNKQNKKFKFPIFINSFQNNNSESSDFSEEAPEWIPLEEKVERENNDQEDEIEIIYIKKRRNPKESNENTGIKGHLLVEILKELGLWN